MNPLKSFFLFVGLLMTTPIWIQPALAQGNMLRGQISLPSQRSPRLGRVLGYEGRSSAQGIQPTDVYVVAYPLTFTPRTQPVPNAVITQQAETFIPHVLVVTPMSIVYFLNEDQEYHNVFSRTIGNSFNIGRRPPGHMYPQRIDRPGLVKLFCDIHSHMRAYIICVETPYFCPLDPYGNYALGNLPDGQYRVELVHPDLGTYQSEVRLVGGVTETLNLDLSQP